MRMIALAPVLPVVAERVDLVDDVAERAVEVVVEVRARRREAGDGARLDERDDAGLVQSGRRHRAAHASGRPCGSRRCPGGGAGAPRAFRGPRRPGNDSWRSCAGVSRPVSGGGSMTRTVFCVFRRRSSSRREVSIPAHHGPAWNDRSSSATPTTRSGRTTVTSWTRSSASSISSRSSGIQRLAAEKKLREVEAVRTKSAGLRLAQLRHLALRHLRAAPRPHARRGARRRSRSSAATSTSTRSSSCRASAKPSPISRAATTLWIVTKGHYEEQLSKIQRCGIAPAFAGLRDPAGEERRVVPRSSSTATPSTARGRG